MATLQWSEALVLDAPVMDRTHEEFVLLLADVEQAPDEQLLACWSGLIDHTDAHFSREDQWMQSTGFSSANCHSVQHKVVLQAMRDGLAAGQRGDLALVRELARQLGAWFVHHAQTMDAGLALHLRSVGFDMETGEIGRPHALPAQPMTGCGSAACSPAVEEAAATVA